MFINARPRPDLNGFRSFVPSRIVELSYYRPNSMTNHGKNAWNNLRPVASSAMIPGSWADNTADAASDTENYSDPIAQNNYSESSEAVPSCNQARVRNKSTLAVPRSIGYPHLHSASIMQLETQSPYDLQKLQSPPLESDMPLLGANTNSHGWVTGRSAANCSVFSKAQYSSTAFPYVDQQILDVDDSVSISSSAGGPSLFCPYDSSSANDSFGNNSIDPSAAYTGAFEPGSGPSSSIAVSFLAPSVPGSFNNGKPWYEMARDSNAVDPCGMTLPFFYHGLPDVPPPLWPTQSGQSSIWSQQTAPLGTISPHALSLVAPSSSAIPGDDSPLSSSEWLSETSVRSQTSQESAHDVLFPPVPPAQSRTFLVRKSDDNIPDSKFYSVTPQGFQTSKPMGENSNRAIESATSQEFLLQRSTSDRQNLMAPAITSQANTVDRSTGGLPHRDIGSGTSQEFQTQKSAGPAQNSNGRVLRPRRKLPSVRMSEVDAPRISSDAGVLSRTPKGPVTAGSRIRGSRQDDPQLSLSTVQQYPKKTCSMQRPLGSENSGIKMPEKQISGTFTAIKRAAALSGTEDTAQQRIAKDKFLLDSKRDGKSYKQIRLEGGFTEAESTLRGRHRTLTKKPAERVRKPEWESNDLRLLREAVHELAGDPSLSRPKKVSWKDVSNYIVENGGSYRFGNSTCRKKWSEIYAKSIDQVLS